MFESLLRRITGLDSVERVAESGHTPKLWKILENRPLLILQRPRRSLDPETYTPEELETLIREEGNRSQTRGGFEPWALNDSSGRRLLAFTSQQRVDEFAKAISLQENRIFAFLSADALIPHIAKEIQANSIELNPFCRKSWKVPITPLKSSGSPSPSPERTDSEP